MDPYPESALLLPSDTVEQELIKDPSSELIEPLSEESKVMVDGTSWVNLESTGRC
jgi:hypothetical protein